MTTVASALKDLVCGQCGTSFHVPPSRGRYPHRCPDCRPQPRPRKRRLPAPDKQHTLRVTTTDILRLRKAVHTAAHSCQPDSPGRNAYVDLWRRLRELVPLENDRR